jgi:hypothetical protein
MGGNATTDFHASSLGKTAMETTFAKGRVRVMTK